MAKRKKAAPGDLAGIEMLLAEADFSAMRPALAAAPELVAQVLASNRKRRLAKKAKARKARAKTARKPAPKKKKKAKAARKK